MTIIEPPVPVKHGYTGKWESYELDYKYNTVNAIYELKDNYLYIDDVLVEHNIEGDPEDLYLMFPISIAGNIKIASYTITINYNQEIFEYSALSENIQNYCTIIDGTTPGKIIISYDGIENIMNEEYIQFVNLCLKILDVEKACESDITITDVSIKYYNENNELVIADYYISIVDIANIIYYCFN